MPAERPALVFVHGGGCAAEDWEAQRARFAPAFRVLTEDLPGHGAGPPLDVPSINGLGAWLRARLEREGEGRYVLIAHGMGCRIALEAARQGARPLAAMILIEPSLLSGPDPAPSLALLEARIAEAGLAAFVETAFTSMFVAGSDPALAARIVTRARAWPAETAAALMRDAVRWDAAVAPDALGALASPLLVVQSTCIRDFRPASIAPGATTPFLALQQRLRPDAAVAYVEGVGHFAQIEAAEAVNGAIAAFLEGRPARGSREVE